LLEKDLVGTSPSPVRPSPSGQIISCQNAHELLGLHTKYLADLRQQTEANAESLRLLDWDNAALDADGDLATAFLPPPATPRTDMGRDNPDNGLPHRLPAPVRCSKPVGQDRCSRTSKIVVVALVVGAVVVLLVRTSTVVVAVAVVLVC